MSADVPEPRPGQGADAFGVVDDADPPVCEYGPKCTVDAVYSVIYPDADMQVPQPLCGYHLARYRREHPGLYSKFQRSPSVADPDEAVAENRFHTLGDAEPEYRGARRLLLDALGFVHYARVVERGDVAFLEVVELDEVYHARDAHRYPADETDAGEWVKTVRGTRGVRDVDRDGLAALAFDAGVAEISTDGGADP